MVFSDQAAPEFAEGEFYATTGSQFYASDEKLAGDYSPVRYLREIKLLRRFCPKGRVLDVGCSTGGFLHHLRDRFPGDYEVCGTDVATGALEIAASKGISVLRENFLTWNRSGEWFDAITFWAVLEHVADPRVFLERAQTLLRPGGLCFVLVPNIRSLAVRVAGAKYRYILPQHLNYFSRSTLRDLLQKGGFEALFETSMHFNPIVILQDVRSRSGLVGDQERAKLLVKTNSLKSNPLLTPVRWCYAATESLLGQAFLADNLVMVGRKG